MAKDMATSPETMGFNESDVQQIVTGMFDANKTPSTTIKAEGHGRVLEITFSNKNPGGSYKTEKRVFATDQAADHATVIANKLISDSKGSFSFTGLAPTAVNT